MIIIYLAKIKTKLKIFVLLKEVHQTEKSRGELH